MGCSFEFTVGKSCGVDWDDGLGQAEGTCNEKSGDADGMGQGAVRKVCVGKVSPTMSIEKCYGVVGTRDDQLAQCGQ